MFPLILILLCNQFCLELWEWYFQLKVFEGLLLRLSFHLGSDLLFIIWCA
jgi:hypothetical protein